MYYMSSFVVNLSLPKILRTRNERIKRAQKTICSVCFDCYQLLHLRHHTLSPLCSTSPFSHHHYVCLMHDGLWTTQSVLENQCSCGIMRHNNWNLITLQYHFQLQSFRMAVWIHHTVRTNWNGPTDSTTKHFI